MSDDSHKAQIVPRPWHCKQATRNQELLDTLTSIPSRKTSANRPPDISAAATRTATAVQRSAKQATRTERRGKKPGDRGKETRTGDRNTHNKMLLIQRGDRAAAADLLVHERLRERRLVQLVVAPGAKASFSIYHREREKEGMGMV